MPADEAARCRFIRPLRASEVRAASTKFDRSLRSSFAAIPAIHENALRIPVVLSSAAVNLLIERDVRTLANTRRTSCCTPSGALV